MSEDIYSKYELTVGMEIHVQLKTKTKLFAPVDNDAREAMPNTTVSEICFGLPGTLPVLNKEAVHLAVRAGQALNSKINLFSKFDRKHYFYPDLPMGYQISQFDQPIVGEGKIQLKLKQKNSDKSEDLTIRITRAHLEADAGKLTHPTGQNYSLVDLNRAGTPLLEIVSEPDIHSAEAAKAFAREINLRMRYADVSYANLYYGNMRFDVNISLAPKGSKTLGTRAEIKNLNSFRAVENSINYEFKRQAELLESGQKVVQETRGWDDNTNKTFSQRSKEDAHDYRYMPEPDIPPISLTQEYLDQVSKEVTTTPQQIRQILQPLSLTDSQIETLVERIPFAKAFAEVQQTTPDLKIQKRIANWLIGYSPNSDSTEEDLQAELPNFNPQNLIKLSNLVESGSLSSTAAKEVLEVLAQKDSDPQTIAEELNLIQVSDNSELESLVQQVLEQNPKAVADFKNGEEKAVGFLVGQTMKLSQGKANPAKVQTILQAILKTKL